MISVTAEDAFAAYEAVRHRLPEAAKGQSAYRRVQTVDDIADLFDVFLLDAFGVLNIGDTAIPGTAERIKQLKQNGKRVMVVSNAASVPQSALEQKYRRLGYDFELADIVTSRATLAATMPALANINWGMMIGEEQALDDLGGIRATALGDDPRTYDEVEGFLLIGSGTWTEARQSMLEDALLDHQRPVMVANPDIVAPRDHGFSAEPGYFAHRLADRTGVQPQFFGKPFANIFELAFSRLGAVDRSRVLMVGDSLHTDILGAHSAEVASALVADYGFFAGQDVEAAIRDTGIAPDFLLDRP